MALSPADVDSFIAALHEDPALRDRVRGALLSDEFLAMPESLRELDRAFRERMDAFDRRIDALTARLEEIAEQLGILVSRVNHLDGRVGNLEGWQYEIRYRQHLMAHLSQQIVRARLIAPSEFDAIDDAYQSGELSEADWDDVHRLDVLATGRRAKGSDQRVLALELSVTVDTSDVARAKRRADILRRFEIDAEPMVDGDHILREARILADQLGVTVLVRDSATTDAA